MKMMPSLLPEVLIIEPSLFVDERGWFMESYSQSLFNEVLGESIVFVQDNHAFGKRGALRGLHYQLPPYAQGKLVRVIQGSVWDVAVDVRKSSPRFGQWSGIELSAENKRQLWIPPGFAHGFVTLSETSEFLYKVTAPYNKASEASIVWNDPQLSIAWPTVSGAPYILSGKDAAASRLADATVFS